MVEGVEPLEALLQAGAACGRRPRHPYVPCVSRVGRGSRRGCRQPEGQAARGGPNFKRSGGPKRQRRKRWNTNAPRPRPSCPTARQACLHAQCPAPRKGIHSVARLLFTCRLPRAARCQQPTHRTHQQRTATHQHIPARNTPSACRPGRADRRAMSRVHKASNDPCYAEYQESLKCGCRAAGGCAMRLLEVSQPLTRPQARAPQASTATSTTRTSASTSSMPTSPARSSW
jgi:hypothetical protein